MKLFINIAIAGCISFTTSAQLYIQNNASVNTTGTAIVTLKDINLVNNGTFSQATGGGKILITGTSNSAITGSGGFVPSFDTLEISKTNGANVSAGRSFNVKEALKFSSGNLDINGWVLNFGSTGSIIGESENNHVLDGTHSGILIASANLNAPNAVNVANFGAFITSNANLGLTVVHRKLANTMANNSSSISTINRQYLIQPTNNTNLNATLRMQYLESELNGMMEPELKFYKSESPYTITTDEGFTTRDETNNYVEKTGIQSFSIWSLGMQSIPLGIDLVTFEASCDNGNTRVHWKTAQEKEESIFQLEYSGDAVSWKTITSISVKQDQHDYDFKTSNGKGFFRLKIASRDGSENYSDILQSDCEKTAQPFTCWPNPATNVVYLKTIAMTNDKVSISIFDLNGRLVLEKNATLQNGKNTVALNVVHLNAGAYFIKVLGAGQQANFKIIKQ